MIWKDLSGLFSSYLFLLFSHLSSLFSLSLLSFHYFFFLFIYFSSLLFRPHFVVQLRTKVRRTLKQWWRRERYNYVQITLSFFTSFYLYVNILAVYFLCSGRTLFFNESSHWQHPKIKIIFCSLSFEELIFSSTSVCDVITMNY